MWYYYIYIQRVCQDNEACARCAKNASSAAICAQLQCDYTVVVMDEAIPSTWLHLLALIILYISVFN